MFNIRWHKEVQSDLSKIHPRIAAKIVGIVKTRLSISPVLVGEPLKGTSNKLWKLRYSKYRIVYTVNFKSNDVWILSVDNRDTIYRERDIQNLVKLALAIEASLSPNK